MEITSRFCEEEEEQIELPPGFRFHPTDEELITHYLSPKVLDSGFQAQAIGEVDLNKCEPWELPWRAKMGEKEWYFFYLRDRKYPTGLRTNRATDSGYWKATGKDKEIHRRNTLVGMKKTLVFYKGRAPKGLRTDWVMHEYRLEGNLSWLKAPKLQNEWVICRVFEKSAGGKRTHITGLVKVPSELSPLPLPPLMGSSPQSTQTRLTEATTTSHVTCFSEPMNDLTRQEDSSLVSHIYIDSNMENLQISDHYGHGLGHHDHEQSLLRMLLDNYGHNSTGGGGLNYKDPFWKWEN